MKQEKIRIEIERESVTAHVYPAAEESRAKIALLLGHGAGADQTSDFMVSFAAGLAARGIETMTFNFLYTERGRRAPDRNEKLEQCYRAAIAAARDRAKASGKGLAIGGKSLGGRIASQVSAAGAGEFAGLVFLGYPLHPPGKPDQLRADHLPRVDAPMFFVQGSRDAFGTPDELRAVIKNLGGRGSLYVVEGGDHSFAVSKKRPVSQEQVYGSAQDEIARWLQSAALNVKR